MKDVIEKLIVALQSSGIESSPEELADIVWYASKSANLTATVKSKTDIPPPRKSTLPTEVTAHKESEESDEPALPLDSSEKAPKSDPKGQPREGADLYSSDTRGSGANGVPFRAPGGKALPNALRLSRALRPLIKRISSPTQFVIDEAATANQIAESNIWLPVIKNAPMRWFDLTLVIESSPSMRLWEQTTKELRQLFEHLGAFRDIRVWRLETHSDESHFALYTEGSTTSHSYKELIEPALPRLIVIVSDCLSLAWQNPEFIKCMDAWGKEHLVSIVQMLPQRLWPQSGLKQARLVRASASGPGGANRTLQYRQATMGWQKKQFSGKYPVPLISLETGILANWARLITSSGNGEPVPAFIFNATEKASAVANPYFDPVETLTRFKAVASPVAFRLACYLSAVPLRLPIMRLVQRVQLPESEQTHLAEFFLSGLIKRLSSFDVTDADEIEYEFRDGIRDQLLALTPVTFVLEVQEVVSDFINEQYGTSIDFLALINLAAQGEQYQVAEEYDSGLGSAFARVTNQVLNMVGLPSMLNNQDVSDGTSSNISPAASEKVQNATNSDTRENSIAPKEKINITYQREVNGKIEEVELPNNVLVIGEFARSLEPYPLEYSQAININKDNFNQVLKTLDVSLDLFADLLFDANEDNYELVRVELRFGHINDFSPDSLIRQVPHINEVLEKRNELVMLQRQFQNFPEVKDHLQSVLSDEKARGILYAELGVHIDDTESSAQYDRGIIESLLKKMNIKPHDPEAKSLRLSLHNLLVNWADENPDNADFTHDFGLDALIAGLELKMGKQLDSILHNESFQALESAWRGLKYLVDNTDFTENTLITVINAPKDSLYVDAMDYSDVAETWLYKKVFSEKYGTFDEAPYSTIVTNYEYTSSNQDIELIKHLTEVGAASKVQVIGAASPQLFGLADFEDLLSIRDFQAVFEDPQYTAWRGLRESEDACFFALTLPRFLLRLPYGASNGINAFSYNEAVEDDSGYFCWGNAAFALAVRINNSFAKYRWSPNIVGPSGGGQVEGLPIFISETNSTVEAKAPTETLISDRREFELAEAGFVPLVYRKGSDTAVFFSANSIQKAKFFGNSKEEIIVNRNYKLRTQLPYQFVINRFVQYVMVLQRELIGRDLTERDLASYLNNWIRQFVADQDGLSPSVRALRPLRSASIKVDTTERSPSTTVEYVEDLSTALKFTIQISPHFKHHGSSFTLSSSGKLIL